jgi:RNA polymerase sigma-70 factor (ECF subfamily)
VSDTPAPAPGPLDRDPAPEPQAIRPHLRYVPRSDGSGTAAAAEPTDDELMGRVATGELAALEAVYDRYARLVFSVGLRVLHDRQLAEDVTQEVFLRIWRRPASYNPERGRFVNWLMSVTRNRALDEWRRFARRRRVEDQEDAPSPLASQDRADDPELGLALAELRRAVREAMTRLPPAQREVLELAYFGGMTQVEIAERTGDPLGTVKTRIRLGMRKLRDLLTDPGDPTADRDGAGGGDE